MGKQKSFVKPNIKKIVGSLPKKRYCINSTLGAFKSQLGRWPFQKGAVPLLPQLPGSQGSEGNSAVGSGPQVHRFTPPFCPQSGLDGYLDQRCVPQLHRGRG